MNKKVFFEDALYLCPADRKKVYDHYYKWAKESTRGQVVQMMADNKHLASVVYQACSDQLGRRDQEIHRRRTKHDAKKAWSESTPTQRRIMSERRGMSGRAKYARK